MNPYDTSSPAWISASTADLETRTRAFIRSVYGWMAVGLVLTALAAVWVVSSPFMQALVLGNRFVMIGLMVVEIGVVIFMSVKQQTISPGAASAAFLVYSFLNGLTLSVIAFIYTRSSITLAFGISAGMYGAMAIYGLVTKRDLTSWGSFFMMGLLGVVAMMVINIFLHSPAINFTIGAVGVFVFLGLTAYDNQKLKALAHAGGGMQDNFAIIGALRLYLDFVNLFLMLLRLFGRRR